LNIHSVRVVREVEAEVWGVFQGVVASLKPAGLFRREQWSMWGALGGELLAFPQGLEGSGVLRRKHGDESFEGCAFRDACG
jgi:hypothetical protein